MRIKTETTERCEECLSPGAALIGGKYHCVAPGCSYRWDPKAERGTQASRGTCPKCDSKAVKKLPDPYNKGKTIFFCESCRWTW